MNGLFNKNIAAKILCMIMAIVLWMYVMNEQNPPLEASFTIPLQVKNLAENYTLLDAPESVRVKVKGVRSVIATITASDISAYIDLTGIGDGRQQVKITAVVPASVELVEINPDKALLRIDTTISRQFPVEVRHTGTLPDGVTLGKESFVPDTITVEGPKSLLDIIDKAIVQVNLTDHNTDFSSTLNVMMINKDGKEVPGVSITPLEIAVGTQLIITNKKIVEVKPTFSGELAAGMVIKQLVVTPAKVELSGSKSLTDAINTIPTEPILINGDTKEFSGEVKVLSQDGLTMQPAVVTVKFTVGLNR